MNSAIRSFVLLALSPVFLGVSGYPSKYSAEAIEAWVVDADTKQPLEGVIVTANWELEESTFGGNVPVGQLMVMEAVTDKNGRFHFPAWGPKKPPKGGLRNKDPQLLLFKPGYRSRGLVNEFRDHMYEEPIRRSEWKTIELKPFKGADMQAQFKDLLSFSKEVESFTTWHMDPCQWTNLPIAINKLMQERKRFEAQNISSTWDRTLDQQLLDGEQYFVKACGSAAQNFFKEMKK